MKKLNTYICLLSGLILLIAFNAKSQVICDTTQKGSSKNLGIYGGLATDIAYSNNGSRLFASCGVPASLFISDDTAKTWYMAFPKDSLEYECETRGWGGGGGRTLTNQKGWIAEYTYDINGGEISTAVISYENGDTATWHTAMDGILFEQMGYSNNGVNGIGLSDYYLYVLLKNYIVRADSLPIDSSDIINIYNSITSGVDSTSSVVNIAIANTVSGYPFYVIIDSSGSTVAEPNGQLYKYDGSNFSKISIPTTMVGINRVFTHQAQITGDTLFITGKDTIYKSYIYRSYDGGTTWTDLTASQSLLLMDVDYSPTWVPQMPLSNGLVLVASPAYISKDLGDTWQKSANLPQIGVGLPFSIAVNPLDTNYCVCSSTPGIYSGSTGVSGLYTQGICSGLEAILVWKIAHNENETEFYLATQSGLAYTTKYKDTLITGTDKWNTPYGKFPIDLTDVSGGITAVGIDPNDTLHVIAGYDKGLFVSSTGPSGFQNIAVLGYLQQQSITKDIAFVNSDIVIAVTGSKNDKSIGMGDIWRSNDGGLTWSNVSPSGFGNGNTIAVGYGKTDTVIYVGTGVQNSEQGDIWKSTDLGQTWIDINNGPDDYYNYLNSYLTINEIEVDPRGIDTLYIVAGFDSTSAFVKSIDGGLTYQYLNFQTDDFLQTLEIDPSNPDSIIYLSRGRSVYLYNPSLDTAIRIYDGLPGENIGDIAIGSILVGTTTGFYSIELEPIEDIVTNFGASFKNANNAIFVYPVPAKDKIYITLSNANTNVHSAKVYLYNAMGSLIAVEKLSQNNEVEISNIKSGTYFVRVVTDEVEYAPQKIVISN